MKHKINKSTLVKKDGYYWSARYSFDENTDNIGRWARICYYNGLMISWVTGLINEDGKVNDKRAVGICNLFLAHLQFPISSNQGAGSKTFDNFEDAKKYTEEMFEDFKKLINKC